ncbi:MAG: sensor histidine kinase [Neomegalonema sp.]|nr:sensor histidine kinase [Neomegalonema sp.]
MSDSAADVNARRSTTAPEQRKWRQWARAAGRLSKSALSKSTKAAQSAHAYLGLNFIQRLSPSRLIAFSQLTTQIFVLSIAALCIQIAGVLYTNEYREGLRKLRLAALKTEASIISVTIAEAAGFPNDRRYDRVVANEVLRRLALQTKLRAQIFDSSGRLTGDTRRLLGSTIIVEEDADAESSRNRSALALLDKSARYVAASFTPQLPLYRETPSAGISLEPEVYAALTGKIGTATRVNSKNELILSVAAPIKQVRAVMGALVLSTEGGDIDQIANQGRTAILQGFAVAAIVTIGLSLALAQNIAVPIRQLSRAAEDGRRREKAPLDPNRIDIPDLSHRSDEIGHLSIALRRMTEALYERIDAIENFAADVAHEIKNPLTSMRSAVESFRNAKTDDQRTRLLEVIEHDVRRMDRLVTEISNASRLDAELVREQRDKFDLVQLLSNVRSICESICDGQDVHITLATAVDSAKLSGLEERLAQVFLNLLDNAASFSPAGGAISMRLSKSKLEGADAWLIEVMDEGPGVPPENLESVFKRFYSERPDAHEFGKHSGLGLAICRQIVEAHGGEIWCDNRADRSGAVFSVALPL